MGYIYILTNPSFPDYIKIGYADDVEKRLQQLNRSECIPFAFRVYATYEVDTRLTDVSVHNMLDSANPELRSVDEFDGKKRIREFYALEPEKAYSFFEEMAKIHGTLNKLKKWDMDAHEKRDEETAKIVQRAKAIDFTTIDIPIGATLELWYHDEKYAECEVVDNRHVSYNGITTSMTAVVKMLLEIEHPAGPDYFKYNGVWINDLRRERGEINF